MTICVKLFSILTTDFREDVLIFLHGDIMETGHAHWRPCVLTDQIRLSCVCGRSPSDYFYQIILNSDHWL